MVFVQIWPFFQLFFSGNIGQENVFYDILERKKAFLGYKSNNFKKSKKLTFFQRVRVRVRVPPLYQKTESIQSVIHPQF